MSHHTPKIIGVDISKAHLDVHRLDTGETAQFDNQPRGFRALTAWIGSSADTVVYESTGPWHRDFERTLAGTLPLARVNALRVRRFAQSPGRLAKTDAIDAQVLSLMGAVMTLRRVEIRSQALQDLDELQTARDALIRDRTATLNRCATLRLKQQ